MKFCIVVPWHQEKQRDMFLQAWGINGSHEWLILQQDKDRSGCALTKNRGIQRAIDAGSENIVILDDDCFPQEDAGYSRSLIDFAELHMKALKPQPVKMFEAVTDPPSRGTPYFSHTVNMEVAASMGFWTEIGDYDAPGQLVHGARKPMQFRRETIFGRYFPLCGMNLAFNVKWWPYCQFINVPRFDDIWQGFIWEKRAYELGCCFNLGAPLIKHARQSNVFANLRDEAPNMEKNESLWHKVHVHPTSDYDELRALI